jgi:Holliday junction resolvasome RuvABC endonuclease subunit
MRRKIINDYVIGIDPSSDLGWSVIRCGSGKIKYLDSGGFSLKDFPTIGAALCAFENLLLGLLTGKPPESTVLVHEQINFQVASGGVKVGQMYGRIVGIIEKVCHQKKIRVAGITPNSARKFAVGKGNMEKSDARDILEGRFGIFLNDRDGKRGAKKYDQSDALVVSVGYAVKYGMDA